MKRFLLFLVLATSVYVTHAQIYINEISQGNTGNREYVEFVVTGPRTCTDSTRDLRGIIFDDNPGWYGSTGTGAGCFRFANVAVWSQVPLGSIIVIYNAAAGEKNTSIIAPDDPTDANGDGTYLLPSNHSSLEVATLPTAANSTFDYNTITGWGAPTASSWNNIVMGNGGDVLHVVNPAVSTTQAIHSIGFGTAAGGAQTPTIYFAGNAAGLSFHNIAGQPWLQSSWTSGAVPTTETPGQGNNLTNLGWVAAMRVSIAGAGRMYVDSNTAASGTGLSWASPKKTLAEAIAVANSGNCVSEVWVKKGTYHPTAAIGHPTINRDTAFRVLRNGIRVYGGFGNNDTTLAARNTTTYPTILSGDIGVLNDSTDNSYHVLTITATAGRNLDSSTRVDGFTITRGNANGGGGTFTISGTPAIRGDGGGILLTADGLGDTVGATIAACTFTRNNANVGGAVYCAAYNSAYNRTYIRNTTVTQNTATNVGGIHSRAGSAMVATSIDRCIITENRATSNGGGAGLLASGSATVNVNATACIISNNTSASSGGAINFFAGSAGSFTLNNCVLSGNKTTDAGGAGGGAINVASGSTATFNNSTVYNNTSASTASPRPNAIRTSGTTVLNNTIVWGDSAQQVNGTATYNHSDVRGIMPPANSLSIDPFFINPSDPDGADNIWATTDDGLRLDTCSQLINGGSNTLIPGGISTDVTGSAARILNTTVDMGAYEHPYNFSGFPQVTVAASPQPACPGTPITVTASATNGGVASYQWFVNSNAVQSGPAATFTSTSLLASDTVWTILSNTDCGFSDTSNRVAISILPAQLHVDASAAVSGTGFSWSSPLKTVDEALDIANASSGCTPQILVKHGTYYPMLNPTTIATSRDSSLRIVRNGIKLYGGFGGNDTTFATRNPVLYPTILSGDLGVASDTLDDAYHVLTIVGRITQNIDTATVVDGFTVRAGRANSTGTLTVNGQTILRNMGGGIYNAGSGTGNAASPLLQNLTVTMNGAVNGAGIFCQGESGGKSSPVIRSSVFTGNRANGGGGGIYSLTNGGGTNSPTVRSCSFTGNYALNNGGAAFFNASGATSSPTIEQCTFTGNSTGMGGAAGTQFGGALAFSLNSQTVVKRSGFSTNSSAFGGGIASLNTSSLTIDSCSFSGDTSRFNGGGIYVQGGSVSISADSLTACKSETGGGLGLVNTTASLAQCTFSQDTARLAGAALYFSSNANCAVGNSRFLNNWSVQAGAVNKLGTGTLSFNRCVFASNSAGLGSGPSGGGALQSVAGTTNLINCVLSGNVSTTTSGLGGGALLVQTGATVNLYNTTLSNNASASTTLLNANSISVQTGGTVNLYNSIVWGPAAQQVAGLGSANYNHALVRGGLGTAPNLNIDPQFVNPSDPDGTDNIWATTDDGLRLDTCSPAVNAGNNVLIPAGTANDITGAIARILNTTVDMGAYEHSYSFAGFPDVTITATPQPACAGVPVTFTATATAAGIASYQWFRNSLSVQTGTSTTFTSSTLAANDTVWVVLTNTACNLRDTSNRIVVNVGGTPPAPGSITGNTTPCVGTSQSYSIGAVAGATSYTWNVPGGAGGGWTGSGTITTTPTFTTTIGATSGNVSVTANTSCGASLPANLAVTVQQAPAAPAVITGNAMPCVGSVETFSTTAIPGATYTWTLPGAGWSGTSATASLSATVGTASGNISVSAANICGPSPATIFAVAPIATPATPGSITGNAAPCAGSSQTYSVPPVPGATTYNWTLPSGWSPAGSTTNSITTTPSSTAGNITVTAINICGTSSMSVLAVVPSGISGAPSAIAGDTSICAGTSNSYSIAAVPGATAYNWTTPAGWVGVPTNNSLTATASTTSGTVSVTVTNACGTSAPVSLAVSVNTVPAQPGTVTGNAAPCVGTSQTYSIAGVPGATGGYTWTTPGAGWAGTSNTTSLNVTAGSATGNITVTANNACGSSAPRTFAVLPNNVPAQPLLINGSAQPCIGVAATYSIAAVNNTTSYTWTVPTGWAGGFSSTTVVSTTPTAANGNVTVTANNVCGSSVPASLSVTPITTPLQPGTMTVSTQICQGAAGTYSVPAVPNASSYIWTLPPGWTGSSTSNTIIATPGTAAATAGTISVTTSNACGTSIARTATVSVTPLPGTPSGISGPSPACAGSTQVYSSAGSAGATDYVWTLPTGWGGSSTTSSITTVVGSTAGTITVRGQNACGQSPVVSLSVAVNPLTVTSASITAAGTTTVCPGLPVVFNATVTGGGTSPSYVWTRNGTVQGGITGTTFTVSNPVTGDVIGFQMTSSAVCAAPPVAIASPITITVLPPVVPGININTQFTTAPTICAATQLNFAANIIGGGTAPAYQWRRNGIVVGTNAPTYSAANWTSGETVYATLTSNAQCATPATINSNVVNINVAPNVAPSVSITASPSTTFVPGQPVTFTATVNGGGPSPSIQWLRNSQTIIGAFGSTYTTTLLTGGDTISARLTSADPCATSATAFSNGLIMVKSTDISSLSNDAAIRLYPNPNDGRFTLAADGRRAGLRTSIQVFNALGQVVWTRELITEKAAWSVPVTLADVAAGVYLLRVTGEDGSRFTQRFEVQPRQ